jgi:outer membrane receptor protein involved in Fe transport
MQARWGGEARLNLLQDSSITANSFPIWNTAAFANNEALLGRWRLTTGLRVDHQTLTDYTLSPRLSLVFSPSPGHQLRAAFNSGYNNPSLVENFASLPIGPAGMPVLSGKAEGLLPERIYYGELAYGGTIAWLRLFADVFAYQMTHSITIGAQGCPIDPMTMAARVPCWTNSLSPVNGYGGEMGFDVAPNRTISGYAHYAYLHLAGGPYAQPGASSSVPANNGSPLHKVTAGLRLDLPRRVYLTADGQYFGATEVARLNDRGMPTPQGTIPAYWTTSFSPYVMLHARTGIAFDNGLDVSIAATNLLNYTEAQLDGAQNPRLRVMATIAYTP